MELLTTLPDGTTIHAVPLPDADVWESLHDSVHLIVSKALGLPSSATLHRVANKQPLNCDLVRLEEAATLAVTAYARAAHTAI